MKTLTKDLIIQHNQTTKNQTNWSMSIFVCKPFSSCISKIEQLMTGYYYTCTSMHFEYKNIA